MQKRVLIALLLSCSVAFAADPPSPKTGAAANVPSEASIKELLTVTNARNLAASTMTQMDAFMKNAMQQAIQGRPVPARIQKDIDARQSEMIALLKEELDWKKLEPFYVRVYQQSFTQKEIDGMLAFYKTPTGQALIQKMPVVIKNTMNEMQKMIAPMMKRIERMQQEVVAELQAEQGKQGKQEKKG